MGGVIGAIIVLITMVAAIFYRIGHKRAVVAGSAREEVHGRAPEKSDDGAIERPRVNLENEPADIEVGGRLRYPSVDIAGGRLDHFNDT